MKQAQVHHHSHNFLQSATLMISRKLQHTTKKKKEQFGDRQNLLQAVFLFYPEASALNFQQ
jgi:hypothetical protein